MAQHFPFSGRCPPTPPPPPPPPRPRHRSLLTKSSCRRFFIYFRSVRPFSLKVSIHRAPHVGGCCCQPCPLSYDVWDPLCPLNYNDQSPGLTGTESVARHSVQPEESVERGCGVQYVGSMKATRKIHSFWCCVPLPSLAGLSCRSSTMPVNCTTEVYEIFVTGDVSLRNLKLETL